jgi:protein-S-isoprenylcysteine O-methyltransferase Ste14
MVRIRIEEGRFDLEAETRYESTPMSLQSRLILRLALVLPLTAALMFGPAGSFGFWQGWVFVVMFTVFSFVFAAYFSRRDQRLVERRLEGREPRREQRLFKMLWVPLWIITLVLPGFDYRFGWSAVPPLVTGVSIAAMVVGWLMVFHVMRFNSFASAVVKVEAGQKVITDGPYRLVRHPMYSGFVLMILAAPTMLGSWVALAPAVALIPVLVFRLRDEERMLRKELEGYAEYCERVRYRLVPYLF